MEERRIFGITVGTWQMLAPVLAGATLAGVAGAVVPVMAPLILLALTLIVVDVEQHPRLRARRSAKDERKRDLRREEHAQAAEEWRGQRFEVRHRHSMAYGVYPGWPSFRDRERAIRLANSWSKAGTPSDVYDLATGRVVGSPPARGGSPGFRAGTKAMRVATLTIAAFGVGVLAGRYSSNTLVHQPVREPCVAFTYLPEIAGYEPTKIEETIVWLDGPVFDHMFAGCDKPHSALLAVTPDNLLVAIRKGRSPS